MRNDCWYSLNLFENASSFLSAVFKVAKHPYTECFTLYALSEVSDLDLNLIEFLS